MKSHTVWNALFAAGAVALAWQPSVAAQVGMQPVEVGTPTRDTIRPQSNDFSDLDRATNKPHMSAKLSAIMKDIFAAAAKKDWGTATTKLAEARALADLKAFDLFEIEVASAFVSINTNDHAGALASYRKVIASPLFASAQTAQEQAGTLRNTMILSNEAADYPTAISCGERLATMGAVDEGAAVALAAAYLGNKDYAKARDLAQNIVDTATAAGTAPSQAAVQIATKSKEHLP